jgi:uncharacterized membrane protein
MRIRLESAKRLGRKIGLNEEKGYAVAIFLALLIVSATVIGYFVWFRPQAEPYNTIYLLDSQKKALDYPEFLVANQNSTFNVYVNVVNHMGGSDNQTYQVLVKITPNLLGAPVDVQPIKTYDISLRDGDGWQDSASITQDQVGSFSVVFELWHYNQDSKTYEFTANYCVLNIQVTG